MLGQGLKSYVNGGKFHELFWDLFLNFVESVKMAELKQKRIHSKCLRMLQEV